MKAGPAAIFTVALCLAAAALAAGLETESLGGIRICDRAEKVIMRYGPPGRQSGPEFEPATGCDIFTYTYPAQGLEFVICESGANGERAVHSIRAFDRSRARTARGRRIRSRLKCVQRSYPGLADRGQGVWALEDEELYVGLYFIIKDGRVDEIIFTTMPE